MDNLDSPNSTSLAVQPRADLSGAVSHRAPTAVGRARVPTFTGQRSHQVLADGDDLGAASEVDVVVGDRQFAVRAGSAELEQLLRRMRASTSW